MVQQIRTEAAVDAGLDNLRFHLKSKVSPTVVSPLRKEASYPMPLEVFEILFPSALKFDPPLRETRALSYLSSRKVYEIELTCDELAVMLGKEWFYTFGGAEVAVHVGKVLIRLQEKQRVEYKTTLNMDCPVIIRDTMETETRHFCRIEFSYRKVTRWDRDFDGHKGDRPDTEKWKVYARKLQLMNYKKVRVSRVFRKVAALNGSRKPTTARKATPKVCKQKHKLALKQ